MLMSTRGEHDVVSHWQVGHIPPSKGVPQDYRKALLKKMSELNSSAKSQHQLAAGLEVYENFCGGDNNMHTSPKPSPHGQLGQLRSRQMNGQAGGDPPGTPNSPGAWHNLPQYVRCLQQELEERKSRETQLHLTIKVLRQQQAAGAALNLDQGNGFSLTPDGLPAAPSSDGIVDSVKDGHIRRLGREMTVLKAKLHEMETKLSEAQRERDLACQKCNSLSSLLADSDRRAANLEQRLTSMAGKGDKDLLDKQSAEIINLKESVQRLNRENQGLKESAALLSSRQPSSFGTNSGGSSSVAGCSQELDYLHKVVDTLKVTVQEQHAKLCSLRHLQDKLNQAPSSGSGSVKALSFPVISSSSTSCAASTPMATNMQGSAARGAVTTHDDREWSVDGLTHRQDILSASTALVAPTKPTTAVSNNTSMAASNNLSASSRSHQAVQDDEMVNMLHAEMQKLVISGTKPIPGVNTDTLASENKGGLDIPNFLMQNNAKWVSQNKSPTISSEDSEAGAQSSAAMAGHKSQSQVLAPRRTEVPSGSVAVSSGSRPLSKSEVIGVNSGLNRPSVSRSSSTHITSGAPSKDATFQDLLDTECVAGRPDPSVNPAAISTCVADGTAASNLQPQRLPFVSGMAGYCATSAALQMPSRPQLRPQFLFESEVEDCSETYPVVGRTDFQQQRVPVPASSAGFTPQQPTQVQASSTSPLSAYQTASAAVSSDREGLRILNRNMMGGGNMIYQQNPPLYQPQQVPFRMGAAVDKTSQNSSFTAQSVSPHGPQQQQQQPQFPYTSKLSSPVGGHQTVHSNISHQDRQTQQLDPSGPRVNSDRSCPVCGQDFSHVPMEDFQAHVYECFDEAGPETMKAASEERSSGGASTVSDRTCPVCSASFEPVVPQAEFERHVHSHFGEENFEIVS